MALASANQAIIIINGVCYTEYVDEYRSTAVEGSYICMMEKSDCTARARMVTPRLTFARLRMHVLVNDWIISWITLAAACKSAPPLRRWCATRGGHVLVSQLYVDYAHIQYVSSETYAVMEMDSETT